MSSIISSTTLKISKRHYHLEDFTYYVMLDFKAQLQSFHARDANFLPTSLMKKLTF